MPNVHMYVPPDGPRFVLVVPTYGRNVPTQFFKEIREKSQYSDAHCSFVADRTHAMYFRSKESAESMALIVASRFPKDCMGRFVAVPLIAPKPVGDLDLIVKNTSASGDVIGLNCEVISGDAVGVSLACSLKTEDFALILRLLDAVGMSHAEGWNSFTTEQLEQIPFRATVKEMGANRFELTDFKKSDIIWSNPARAI